MEIEWRDIKKLIPYAQNTKKHDAKQVANIANSIKRFGWRQPIVVDKNGVVVIGHGRLLAAKKLGHKKVPVTVAGDLSDEDLRELRIADNKTNESEWDAENLNLELPDLDFEGFDFDFSIGYPDAEEDGDGEVEEEYDEAYKISRLTHNTFENFERDFEPIYTGKYDIPVMQVTHTTGDKFLRFCDWRQVEDYSEYIAHFYYDDFKFIKAWRDPDCYLERLRAFRAIVAPDFSLYTDFPKTLQILSCYRRQWIGAYYQSMGIDVIPDVIWGDKSSYEFCFDGIPKGGTVAVSSVGVKRDKDWNGLDGDIFRDGYAEMMKRLEPETVLFYGDMIDGINGNIIRIPSFYAERREMLNEKARVKRDGQRK